MTDTATLITQLRVLAQLTRAEAHVARSREAQASTHDVRDDLRRNAADADARAARIGGLLHELGALPDPVTPLVGRVASLVRGAMEQVQPLDEAVLGDLALEHQLRDRARYVAELAGAADLPAVHELANDLEAAHTETVEWLTGVLADLAGGQAALRASPLQVLAAQVTRAANTPARTTLGGAAATVSLTVERAVGTVAGAGNEVGRELTETAEPLARHLPGAGAPNVPLDAPDAGATVPPIPGFADLPAHAAVAALRTLDDPRDVAATLEFEQEHGNRPGVVAAARLRSAALGAG
jgi:hypothetical protein